MNNYFCSYCGKKIENNPSYCPYCGKKLLEERRGAESTYYSQRTDNKNQMKRIIIGIVGICIAVIAIIFWKKQSKIDMNNTSVVQSGIDSYSSGLGSMDNLDEIGQVIDEIEQEEELEQKETWIELSESSILIGKNDVVPAVVEIDTNARQIENQINIAYEKENIVEICIEGNTMLVYPLMQGKENVTVKLNGAVASFQVSVVDFAWGETIDFWLDEESVIQTSPLEISDALVGPMVLKVKLEVSNWNEYEPKYFQVWYIDKNGYYDWLGDIDLSVQQVEDIHEISIPAGIEVNELIFSPYCQFDRYDLRAIVYLQN